MLTRAFDKLGHRYHFIRGYAVSLVEGSTATHGDLLCSTRIQAVKKE